MKITILLMVSGLILTLSGYLLFIIAIDRHGKSLHINRVEDVVPVEKEIQIKPTYNEGHSGHNSTDLVINRTEAPMDVKIGGETRMPLLVKEEDVLISLPDGEMGFLGGDGNLSLIKGGEYNVTLADDGKLTVYLDAGVVKKIIVMQCGESISVKDYTEEGE